MTHITKFVGRDTELSILKSHLNSAIRGNGNTVFVSGETGIGKTRIIDELGEYAKEKSVIILKGRCICGADADPFLPFCELLKCANLEYLLAEKPPKVENVFLVTNSGYLMLTGVHREKTNMDTDVFTSMLGAVQDFVKDSFTGFGKGSGHLDTLGYGDYRIMVSYGKHVHLIVMISGVENEFLKDHMNKILESVEEEYGTMLDRWNGNLTRIKKLKDFISPLIFSGMYDGIALKIDPKIKREGMFENVSQGLINLSKEKPLLLFLDDLQWADPSSLSLLHYIARNMKESNLMLIGSYRPEDLDDAKVTHILTENLRRMKREKLYDEIRLKKLKEKDIANMIKSIFKAEPPKSFVKKIYKQFEGNPFFTEETLLSLQEDRIIDIRNNKWPKDLKIEDIKLLPMIEDVIARKFERLGANEIKVLKYASFIGETFRFDYLQKTLEMNEIELFERIETAIAKKFIYEVPDEEGKFRFSHALIKDYLRNTFSQTGLRLLCKKIGESIEEINKRNLEDVYAELAYYFSIAKSQDRFLKYSILAGNKASSKFAHQEAIRHYSNALKNSEDIEQKAKILYKIGGIYLAKGVLNEALKYYTNFLDSSKEINNKNLISLAYMSLGHLYCVKSKWDDAMHYYAMALQALDKNVKSHEMAEAYRCIAIISQRQGRLSDAMQACNESMKILTTLNDILASGRTAIDLGNIYSDQGNYDAAMEWAEKSIELLTSLNAYSELPRAFNYKGEIYRLTDRFDDALECYKECINIASKVMDMRWVAYGHGNSSYCYIKKGNLEKAMAFSDRAMKVFEKLGEDYCIAGNYMYRGIIYGYKKNWMLSDYWFTECFKLMDKLEIPYYYAEARLEYGLVCKLKGDKEKAIRQLERAMGTFRNIGAEGYASKVEKELMAIRNQNGG